MARFDSNDDIFECEKCGFKRNPMCAECRRQANERRNGRRLARLIERSKARQEVQRMKGVI